MNQYLVRVFNWILVKAIYKVKINKLSELPESGALLISNHVSYLDACLIQASLRRQVRFLMYKPIYENFLIKPIAKALGAIPIDPSSRETVVSALSEATEAIRRGELVCIFPEGAITRLGVLQPFKKGMESIMKDLDAPIVPIWIDQMWGSIFSFKGKKFIWKIPRELPYRVSLSFGEHLTAGTSARLAYEKVEELSTEAFSRRDDLSQLLHKQAIRRLKLSAFRKVFSDTLAGSFRGISVLALSLIIAKKLKETKRQTNSAQNIGIHLPTSVVALASNLGALVSGSAVVNLNYTVALDSLSYAIKEADIKIIISSRKFIERFPLPEASYEIIYIEDVLSLPKKDLILKCIEGLLLPSSLLIKKYGRLEVSPNDTAAILFSSGSTGVPKGVLLSHKNIICNITSIIDLFDLTMNDKIIGTLPFFHSFGFTITLWLPLVSRCRAAYHANPLEGNRITKLIKEEQGTLFFSTPTFLQMMLKKSDKSSFSSLREIMLGAEKLTEEFAKKVEELTGVSPKEGYGCTELSPLALVNTTNYGSGRNMQKGEKLGTVGLPIPGVSIKIVNPDTFDTLSANESGMLLVKGGNVMKGYLNNQELTKEVIREGWYVTGDIAKRDDEGFITITDRLSRFSKIAGEMVPHGKVEEILQEFIKEADRMLVVIGASDEKKGEKLLVLHKSELDIKAAREYLKEKGLPNLWIPAAESFFKIDEIPVLATGKLDLSEIKKIAKKLERLF